MREKRSAWFPIYSSLLETWAENVGKALSDAAEWSFYILALLNLTIFFSGSAAETSVRFHSLVLKIEAKESEERWDRFECLNSS